MNSRPLVIVAHNIRSIWNVGSLFRTADAFSVTHIHLTGYTVSPPRPELSKTALGAETWISWSKDDNPLRVIAQRKKEGFRIISLEITEKSTPIAEHHPAEPVCLVLGHEILGVSDELMAASDDTVHLPMLGKKKSLNVSVAAGIALHHYRAVV